MTIVRGMGNPIACSRLPRSRDIKPSRVAGEPACIVPTPSASPWRSRFGERAGVHDIDSLVGLTQAQIAAAHWDTSKPGLPLLVVESHSEGRAELYLPLQVRATVVVSARSPLVACPVPT